MNKNFIACAALVAAAQPSVGADLRAVTFEPVVVTATRFPQPPRAASPDVVVIAAEDIEKSSARTVPELLAEQAGITLHDLFGNEAATPTVGARGFGITGTQNTLILVDGRPVVDPDLSGVQWAAFPLGAIERVEVMRGAGGVLYGAGATGGVINLITRSPAAGPPGFVVRGRLGSYGLREGQVSATAAGSRAAASLHGSHLASDGYRRNNETRQSTALADLRWLTEGGELSVKLGGDRQGMRLPGARTVQPSAGIDELSADRRGAATPLDWSQRDGNRAAVDWRGHFAGGELILGGAWRDKTQRSYFDFGGFPDYRVADLDVWSLTPRLKFPHRLAGAPSETVAGADWYRWDYRLRRAATPATADRPFNLVDAEQDTRALYAQNTTTVAPGVAARLGVRGERHALEARDRHDAGAPGGLFGSAAPPGSQRNWLWAYEAGIRYALARGAMFASTSRGYRYANVDEIYETSEAFTSEFQFLRPQTSRTHEAGYGWRGESVWLRTTLFRIDVRDEIHLDPYTAGVGNRNLPPSRRRGLELEGRWQATRDLALRASYARTHATFREGVFPGGGFALANQVIAGKTVPLVPRDQAHLSAAWTLGGRTLLIAALTYVGSQYMDNDEANTLGARIPAYTVTHLKLTHRQKGWRYTAAINNVTNERYYSYAVRSAFVADRYNAYPLPGRTYSFAGEYAFH